MKTVQNTITNISILKYEYTIICWNDDVEGDCNDCYYKYLKPMKLFGMEQMELG